jgi:toxin ParE1/3/4
MDLLISPRAEEDLETIADHIALDSPKRAVSFVRALRKQCDRIALGPESYRKRPELGDSIRSCAYRAYVVFLRPPAGR